MTYEPFANKTKSLYTSPLDFGTKMQLYKNCNISIDCKNETSHYRGSWVVS